MTQQVKRRNGRLLGQMRNISVSSGIYSYAPGSILFEQEETKVLCTVSMMQGVPHFLRGKKEGWLTAEYALLPHATQVRTARESVQGQRTGRSIEISRLIGRALRTIVNVASIGENTIYIDCDVLKADGGTRAAAITAACLALEQAQAHWLANRIITAPIIAQRIAGISVGICKDTILVDPDYAEDSTIDADFNIIMTESGQLIEMQGGAEKKPISWELFQAVQNSARTTVQELFAYLKDNAPAIVENVSAQYTHKKEEKVPLFSLRNRLLAQAHEEK